MHRPLLIAIGIVLVFLFIVHLAKCPCGCSCWRWCPCAQSADSTCCCKKSLQESMVPAVNLNRTITLHSVRWCPHCKVMKPVWDQVKAATVGSGIVFRELDEDIAKTAGISGYPTIRMVTETGATIDYHGPPNFTTLRNWAVSPVKVAD